MRFPWIQVDTDFISAHARDFGAHLGVSRREALGLAVDLWMWALARASDDAPPDGVVTGTGPVPDRLLAGSVDWAGPAEQFTDALVACGLAVRIEGGYRLTGFSRYKATWEKNRRRHGPKPERNRSGAGTEPVRKTQTQTHIEEDLFPAEAVASPAPKRKGGKAKGEKPTDPRHAPLKVALVEGLGYPFRDGRDAKAVAGLLALADQQEATRGEAANAEVIRRARIAWGWVGFPACKSLTELVANWGHYAREQGAGPGPPRPDAHGGILRADSGTCALCGEEGECSSMGEPPVPLCKGRCTGAVLTAVDAGEIHYTEAAAWVARRKHEAA